MKLNLQIQKDTCYIPDVDVPTGSGIMKNRDNVGDEIKVYLTIASIDDRDRYSNVSFLTKTPGGSKSNDIIQETKITRRVSDCVANNAKRIEGLEDWAITSGSDLVAKQSEHELFVVLLEDIYNKIMGNKNFSDGSDYGLSQGE